MVKRLKQVVKWVGQVGRSGDLYARMWHTMGWHLETLIFKTPIGRIQERMKGVPTKTRRA